MSKIQFQDGTTVEVDGEPTHDQVVAIWNDLQSKQAPDIASPSPAPSPQEGTPNKFMDILGSSAQQAVTALPPVANMVNPQGYNDAFMNGMNQQVHQGMNVPEVPGNLISQALSLKFPEDYTRPLTDPNARNAFARGVTADIAGSMTAPINYAIPAAIEAAGLIPIGESTIGKLIQLPINRIKDAITGEVAPEVVDRFLSKIATLKKLNKHLPEKFKSQAVPTSAENVPNIDKWKPQSIDPYDEVTSPKPSVEIPAPQNPELDLRKKMANEVKASKPVRSEQESMYREERAKRFQESEKRYNANYGANAYNEALGPLKGELQKVQYESIGKNFTPHEINTAHDMIKQNQDLEFLQKLETHRALNKMMEGTVPTKREIGLLQKVFGDDLTKALLGKRPFGERVKDFIGRIASTQKSMMATLDDSFPFRQGIFFVSKKEFWQSFIPSLKALANPEYYGELMGEIKTRPNYQLAKEYKLPLTDLGNSLTNTEEQFQRDLAENIPVLGKLVRASNRAFNAFANKLRMDLFDYFLNEARKQGVEQTPSMMNSVVKLISSGTGRGQLGAFAPAAKVLGDVFWSPKLEASRWNILNPMWYANLDPFARKEAIKSLIGMVGVQASVLTLAHMAGAKVETDPRSSDFGKIRIGDTRYDVTGGFGSRIVFLSRILSGSYKSSTTGKVSKLSDPKKYKAMTRLDVVHNYIENKTAPMVSLVISLMKGSDFEGKPVQPLKEIAKSFVPLILQDIYDVIKGGGSGVGAAPGFFGVGVQTYKGYQSKKGGFK